MIWVVGMYKCVDKMPITQMILFMKTLWTANHHEYINLAWILHWQKNSLTIGSSKFNSKFCSMYLGWTAIDRTAFGQLSIKVDLSTNRLLCLWDPKSSVNQTLCRQNVCSPNDRVITMSTQQQRLCQPNVCQLNDRVKNAPTNHCVSQMSVGQMSLVKMSVSQNVC